MCKRFTSKTGITYDDEGRRVVTKSIEEAWVVHIKKCVSLKQKHAETLRGQLYNQEQENK